MIELTKDLTPLNIKAYLYDVFSIGSEPEVLEEIEMFLGWCGLEATKRESCDNLYNDGVGIYHLVFSQFYRADLVEYGCSPRSPWLTEAGRRLLKGLRKVSYYDVDGAQGEAYNGITYD